MPTYAITIKPLAARLAEGTGQPPVVCEALIKKLVSLLNDGAVNREKIHLHGLGTFWVRDMKPRKGRNPKTGKTVDIPAKLRLVFTPAKHLKDI